MCATKHRRRRAAFSAGAVLVVLSSSPTIAQYRVTDLGDNPNVTVTAINSRGEESEVVGYETFTGGVLKAFIWDNATNLRRYLPTLGGPDAQANDINDAGAIVGVSDLSGTVSRASLWLPPYLVMPEDLDTLPGPGSNSAAFGINNADPFQVVGQSDANAACGAPVDDGPLAFQWNQLNGQMVVLGSVGQFNDVTNAFAINTPWGANPLVTVGLAATCGNLPLATDAVAWEGTEGTILDEPFFGDHLATGSDVNDEGELVGRALNADFGDRGRALFWSSVYDVPVNLHTDLNPLDESWAVAINNASQIVGKVGIIASGISAYLWELNGSWVATELNTLTNAVDLIEPARGTWDNLSATVDINDSGWIIGIGDMDTTTGVDIHVFLMTPLGDCPADIDGDGMVGIVDFLELLASWGDCSDNSPLTICTSDVDGDGVVDIVDFLALLAAWGNCPESAGPGPPTLAEELADACLTQDDMDLYVDVMTDPNIKPFQKLRHDCWMRYHLFECDGCACPIALCPGSDPYG